MEIAGDIDDALAYMIGSASTNKYFVTYFVQFSFWKKGPSRGQIGS